MDEKVTARSSARLLRRLSTDFTEESMVAGQDLNLRPSGYETVRHLIPLLNQDYSYF